MRLGEARGRGTAPLQGFYSQGKAAASLTAAFGLSRCTSHQEIPPPAKGRGRNGSGVCYVTVTGKNSWGARRMMEPGAECRSGWAENAPCECVTTGSAVLGSPIPRASWGSRVPASRHSWPSRRGPDAAGSALPSSHSSALGHKIPFGLIA